MTTTDIPSGLRLNQIAGWNQTAADWERFLQASPDGCFVAEQDGQVRGTVATISFQDRFAWISMVLVDPQYRGQGMGTRLLEAAVEDLDRRKISTMKLDATPQGKPLYEKLGFVPEYEIERWNMRRSTTSAPKGQELDLSKKVRPAVLDSILPLDREVFGADRRFLLRSLYEEAPKFAMEMREGGELRGYTFGRSGLFADHLGPWMAKDASSAQYLLAAFVDRSSRETLVVDCLKANAVAVSLVKDSGFTYARLLTRMVRGPNACPGRPDMLCAIAGPEFG